MDDPLLVGVLEAGGRLLEQIAVGKISKIGNTPLTELFPLSAEKQAEENTNPLSCVNLKTFSLNF